VNRAAGEEPARPVSDGLSPGGQARIPEAEWFSFLERGEPLHQWRGAFLYEEQPGGLVRVYLRDDSGAGGHVCVRLDEQRSAAARRGVERVEEAARRAADVITALQGQSVQSVADLAAQDEASRLLVEEADGLYRELLAP
jgi:hypothetical protein